MNIKHTKIFPQLEAEKVLHFHLRSSCVSEIMQLQNSLQNDFLKDYINYAILWSALI